MKVKPCSVNSFAFLATASVKNLSAAAQRIGFSGRVNKLKIREAPLLIAPSILSKVLYPNSEAT